jgi:tRNA pseudouridine55 synthase
VSEREIDDLIRPHAEETPQTAPSESRQKQKKRDKRDVHGWVVLDKPVGMTSTHAVSVIKRLFSAKRAGHAGTLDPLASGALPIALGEATKTVPFVMDGRKVYRFTVRWGEERDTDDAEGRPIASSDQRPSAEAIRALLPSFTGTIQQVPPRYSAIKIEGERAYDLARDGEEVTLAARPVEIGRLELVNVPDPDHAVLEAECGKGTYVRSLARDLGRTALALEVAARNASGGVIFFGVVDGERKEIDAFLGLLCRHDARDHGGLAVGGEHGAVGLARDAACLEG